MKIRVPILGTVGKSVQIESDAPSRAEVTAQITAAVANIPAASTPGVASVIWRFIREIPANVTALANLATAGIMVRTSSSVILTRSIAVADTSRLTITNGSGVAGDPTLDMADIAAVSVWGRSANTTGKPAPIAAGANDRLLARTADSVAFQQLAVGMVPNDELTYAKLQNVSATQRILCRKTAGAGDIEEGTLSEVLDFITSAVQGDILYRGASVWQRLAAGTSGHFLKTLGAGANPAWAASGAGASAFVASNAVAGAAVTTLTVTGLDLDTDEHYIVYIALTNNNASTFNLSVYYNSDTTATNYDRQRIGAAGATVTSARGNDAIIGQTVPASEGVYVKLDIERTPDGRVRCLAQTTSGNTTNILADTVSHVWRTASTNVTQIVLSASTANALAIGSRIRVFRMHT